MLICAIRPPKRGDSPAEAADLAPPLWLTALYIVTLADLLVIKHFVDEAGDPIFPPFASWSTCSPWIGVSVGVMRRGEGDGGITHSAGAADVRSAGSNRFINLRSKRLCH